LIIEQLLLKFDGHFIILKDHLGLPSSKVSVLVLV